TDVLLDRRPVDRERPAWRQPVLAPLGSRQDVLGNFAPADLGHERAAALECAGDLPVRLAGLNQTLNLDELRHAGPLEFHQWFPLRGVPPGEPRRAYDAIRKDPGAQSSSPGSAQMKSGGPARVKS